MKTMAYFDFLDTVNDDVMTELNAKLNEYYDEWKYTWNYACIALYTYIRNRFSVEIPELLTMGA